MNALTEFNKYYYRIQRKINALPTAGRVAALTGVLLIILLLWYLFVQRALILKQEKMREQFTTIIQESKESKLEIDDIIQKITGKAIEEERVQLDEKSKEIEQYLGVLNDEVLAPEQMTEILQKMISQYNSLQLVNFKISPKRILVNTGQQKQHVQLYEQDVTLELRGDYFSTLEYLEELEHLPWRFFWDDLQYNVTDYPDALISIKIHTLGK